MAIASRWLGARYNRPNLTVFDFDVYAILGDGCMMEGISSEAASLAGHLKLPNLCWLYDNNHISLDGKLALSFSEDVPKRFEAYGWATTHVTDANDLAPDREGAPVLQAAGAAHADRGRLAHRLREPEEAGHQRRAR